jgi:ABC-type transporter Mla subunit MlaD
MNALERVLQDDLNRLVDRLAAVTAECAEHRPSVQAQLDRAEARLSSVRQELLRGYAEWRQALEECGDLWAMAALTADQPSEPGLRAA